MEYPHERLIVKLLHERKVLRYTFVGNLYMQKGCVAYHNLSCSVVLHNTFGGSLVTSGCGSGKCWDCSTYTVGFLSRFGYGFWRRVQIRIHEPRLPRKLGPRTRFAFDLLADFNWKVFCSRKQGNITESAQCNFAQHDSNIFVWTPCVAIHMHFNG